MIERVIDWCSSNRFLVFTGTVMLPVLGMWAVSATPLDAVPDISDVQVIVSTEWMGRSPDLIEDQITYPIVSALISTPHVKAVRGFTDFGISYVYVIFQDGTDMYWARSRVVEYLQGIRGQLPDGTNPVIGPDATGVGWVFEYALVDETGEHSLADLRGFQDWHLRYCLASVSDIEGVSLGASPGGTPIRVRDVAQVRLGPDIRRGVAELDGKGEAVGGIIVMRFGENALRVIDGVKAKLLEVQHSMPSGIRIVP